MIHKTWSQFLEDKNTPSQGKDANPYLPAGKHKVGLRVAKDTEKKEPFGSMGGSNVKPSDTSLGVPGGQGGVPVIEEEKIKTPYPNGKVDGKIRVVKDKEKGKDFGSMKSPGMEPSVSSLGKAPEAGVGTTTEQFLSDTKDLSDDDFISHMLKKNESLSDLDDFETCDLDDDFVDDYSGQKVYVPIIKVISRAAKSMLRNPKAPKIFIREVKRMDGGIGKFMEELMTHPEVYSEIAGHIRTNESKAAKKLVKAMNQHYLDHLTEMGMLDVSESVSPPMNKRLSDPTVSTDEPNGGPEMPMGDSLGGPGALGAGAMGAMPGGGGAPSMAGPGANMNMSNLGTSDDAGGGAALAGNPPFPPGTLPKAGGPSMINANKEFGYHHMIKEMGSYDNMKQVMREHLKG